MMNKHNELLGAHHPRFKSHQLIAKLVCFINLLTPQPHPRVFGSKPQHYINLPINLSLCMHISICMYISIIISLKINNNFLTKNIQPGFKSPCYLIIFFFKVCLIQNPHKVNTLQLVEVSLASRKIQVHGETLLSM